MEPRDVETCKADAIAQRAAEWLAILDGGGMTARQRETFAAWLTANPDHARAFERARARWESPELLAALEQIPLSAAADRLRPSTRKRGPRLAAGLALAASLAALAMILEPMALTCLRADYCTDTGKTLEVALPDGSSLALDTASAVRVRFDETQREVQLLRGQALFAVKPGMAQPFRVAGRYCSVKVTGTRFTVDSTSSNDSVTVQSGTVVVTPVAGQPAQLTANDRITVGDKATVAAVEHLRQPEATAWVNGKLLVDDLPLTEVVRQIGRYRKGLLVIGREGLKSLRVSGQFDIRDTDNALKALEQTLPLRIRRITPWLVVIS